MRGRPHWRSGVHCYILRADDPLRDRPPACRC